MNMLHKFGHKVLTFGRKTVLHPFGAMILLLIALTSALIHFHPDTHFVHFDASILAFIAVTFLLALLFMMSRTKWRGWTLLSAGLVTTFMADASLYGLSALTSFGYEPLFREDIVSFIRAAFIVGGLWILMGLVQEWWLEQPPEQRTIRYIITHPLNIFRVRKDRST
jgi:hypothetical protein